MIFEILMGYALGIYTMYTYDKQIKAFVKKFKDRFKKWL